MTTTDSAMTAERLAEIRGTEDERATWAPYVVGRIDELLTHIDALTTERTKLAADLARVEGERDALKSDRARSISRGRILIRVRDALINIKEGIESEVDRTYFGSMNDADMFCEIVGELDAFKWDRIMAEKPEPDVIEECRKANDRARAAEAKSARLEEQINDAEECMQARLHGARVGNEAERVTAVACWEMALHDVRRIFNLTLPEPSHEP